MHLTCCSMRGLFVAASIAVAGCGDEPSTDASAVDLAVDSVDLSVDLTTDLTGECLPPMVRCGPDCVYGVPFQMTCNGKCVNIKTDDFNCGGCGRVCPPDAVCMNGLCFCLRRPWYPCLGVCVDIMNDPHNCGFCGRVCSSGVCSGFQCVDPCPTGLTRCVDCVDTMIDPNHCGACGTVCSNLLVCSHGTCATSCDTGFTSCNRSCVDLTSDIRHRGTCGHPCQAGQSCVKGVCQ